MSPAELIPNLELDTWYVLQIVLDDVGGFTLQAYKESDPMVRGAYRQPGSIAMPAGRSWRFRHWIYRDTAYIDDYRELTAIEYGYDQGTNGIGQRTSMSALT